MDEIIKLAKITVLRDVELEVLNQGLEYATIRDILKDLEKKYNKRW